VAIQSGKACFRGEGVSTRRWTLAREQLKEPHVPDTLDQEREEIVKRHGDLEIEESMKAQRRLWKVQRVVRVIALVILALALAGVLGGGPLSHGRAEQGGNSLEYERIAYRDTPQTYRLQVTKELASSGKARVWWDRETSRRVKVDQIVPEPGRTTLAADRMIFEFEVEAEQGPFELQFEFSSNEAGVHASRIGIEGGPTLEFKQLILP
jgi:hypothetical protein